MIRKRRMRVEVIETHGRDYSGKPYTGPTFRWHHQDRTPVIGSHCSLGNLCGEGMGMVLKPGDKLIVTVEVVSEEDWRV